jgi:hypothetical protein
MIACSVMEGAMVAVGRLLVAMLVVVLPAAAPAYATRPGPTVNSLQSAVDWINDYRRTRDLAHAPLAIRALSYFGGLKDPESSGTYVGFIAGLIGANPDKAGELIDKMLPVRAEDEWAIVRGIAYSGLPNWKALLREHAYRLEGRQIMIANYLNGQLPTLDMFVVKSGPTTYERMREAFAINWPGAGKPNKPVALEPSQEVLDTLWGYYLATGSYRPVLRVVELLPWAEDRNNGDHLTVGSMAKYTLATNASRDAALLAKLKAIRSARSQTMEIAAQLDQVIHAAETADAGSLRKDALAAIEQLKLKGPAYKREMNAWAMAGQGALAVGCVAAAALGQFEFGLPCVIGGGATSAAMYYMHD